MKYSLYFCALGVVIAPLVVSAQPKRMGPSAVEAARLKKYPPPNYLSHYLPDDRYKIAGGVWQYVSTDLDTYYHVPTSANMLRQPANRVIGFANAHDAEEAGYEPDPTDGTAARVAAAEAAAAPKIGSGKSLSAQEKAYLKEFTAFLGRNSARNKTFYGAMGQMLRQTQNTQDPSTFFAAFRPTALLMLKAARGSLADFSRLKPPATFRQAHNDYKASTILFVNGATLFNSAIRTGDLTGLMRASQLMTQADRMNAKAMQEYTKLSF